jgi:uncharacterized membrane protein (DUF373 family)
MTARRDPESGTTRHEKPAGPLRTWIGDGFTLVEDAVYLALALLLVACAVSLIVGGVGAFFASLKAGSSAAEIVLVLDRILLVLMVIELLYTVKVSFQEHALVPEPFLVVGLIAAVRRILIVTAQLAVFVEKNNTDESLFRHAMWELGILTVMVVALVASLLMLRKRTALASAEKSSRSDD